MKRVTIMVDDNVDKKVRIKQARQIESTNGSVSYSKVINELLASKLGITLADGKL